MRALINAWANFAIARRAHILVGVAIFLLVALFTGPDIPFDNNTERYFVDGDPTLAEYDRLLDLFGDNEYLVVGFEASGDSADIFSACSGQLIPDSMLVRFSAFVGGTPLLN